MHLIEQKKKNSVWREKAVSDTKMYDLVINWKRTEKTYDLLQLACSVWRAALWLTFRTCVFRTCVWSERYMLSAGFCFHRRNSLYQEKLIYFFSFLQRKISHFRQCKSELHEKIRTIFLFIAEFPLCTNVLLKNGR